MIKNRVLLTLLIIAVIGAGAFSLIRKINSEKSIVVVNGEQFQIYGEVSFELVDFERMEPVIIKEGRLVLFRTGDTVNNLVIKPGESCRWDKELNLYKVGTFDLEKSNEELAGQFGIKVN